MAVVVITRGSDAHGHLPAAVAGQIYRDLNHRFGTPTNLPVATASTDNTADPKAADDEEASEAAQQRAKEEGDGETDTSLMNEANDTSAKNAPKSNNQAAPRNSKVKPVIKTIPARTDKPKATPGTNPPPKNEPPTEERPRRVSGSKP